MAQKINNLKKTSSKKLNDKVILAGNSNRPMAKRIAKELGMSLGKIDVKVFSDGETYVNIEEDIKDKIVYVVQSGSYPANHNLMELLAIVHAARNLNPKKIVAVVPFYPYRRMEKTVERGESLTFELVADLLHTAGIDKIICMDLHKHRSKRFFKFQRKELRAFEVIISRLRKKKLHNFVIVAPDKGSMPESKKYARELEVPLVKAYKTRKKHDEAIINRIEGDVEGKDVIIVDDEINTAGTLTGVVDKLKQHKVRNIYFACTHAVLSGPAIERLEKAKIKEVIITDTILLPEEKKIKKIKILSVAPLFAQAILDDR
ncbi:MAG: ribose-phosphate pyrophosphokinase [bacterium]|nr:ribose-phosphate pyrophosphokinase [bacterium]